MSKFNISALIGLGLTMALVSRAQAAEVNVYSYRQPELTAPLLEKFTAVTGIGVKLIFAEKGLAERVKAEGANSPADVILTTDIARLAELVASDLVQPVSSPSIAANIPAQYRDTDNRWFGLTQRARVVYASKARVKSGDITSYADMTAPQWKGRICSRSGSADYNVALLASRIAHAGDAAAKQWLSGVKANLARKPQGNDRAQIKAVAEGECDIALGNTYYLAIMLADPAQRPFAEAVNIIFPDQNGNGAHVNISGMAMAKYAPNKDAALKLMEFLSGPEAQKLYAETNNEYPVNPNVPWSALLQSWGKFKPDPLPLQQLATHRIRAQEIVNEVNFDE